MVRWTRPNPPVGALSDKFRPATSELLIACVGRRRYFDLDAVRGPLSPNTHRRTSSHIERQANDGKAADPRRGGHWASLDRLGVTTGAPPLDWWRPTLAEARRWRAWSDRFGEQLWVISTKPYKGAHYATWAPALCERPIKATCPERVCTVCGQPSERVARTINAVGTARLHNRAERARQPHALPSSALPRASERRTVGWTDCGHGAWRRGVVLDPFAGSGTTLAVVAELGRHAIGIDLDERNIALARERVGEPITIEHITSKEQSHGERTAA